LSAAGFQIRVAEVGDLAEVVKMERTIPEAPHWADAEYAAILDSERNADSRVRRCLSVAEADGRLVGFAVGKVVLDGDFDSGVGRFAVLETVAVDAAARRCGVGRALCEAIVAWSNEQGARILELEVRAGSAGAIALYSGLGFVVAGRRRGYYREPAEDAVLMRRELWGNG
jgi:ribosomal-protein-alanine N-acetyltransferase